MRFAHIYLKKVLALCAAGGICAVASAQSNPTLTDFPQYQIGDSWKFRKTEIPANKVTIQIQKIMALEANNRAWMYLENQTTGYKVWWLFDGKKVANEKVYAFDATKSNFIGKLISENTQDSRIQFPVFKGKKYKVTEFWSDKKTSKTDYEIEVVGQETLKTEAGEFNCWKFNANGAWVNVENSTQGETKGEMWYSPEVKRWIKTKFTGAAKGLQSNTTTFELIEWSKGG